MSTTEEQQQQLNLPYDELAKPLGRDAIRAAKGVKNGRATYFVEYERILVRGKFNIRSKPSWKTEEEWNATLGVKELAETLMSGKDCPDIIKGDFTEHEGKSTFFMTDGERRYRAISLLLATGKTVYPNGKPINMVEVLPNPANYTEFDRNRQFYSTNNNMKYTELQWAELCFRMKTCFMKHKDDHTKILASHEILSGKEPADNFIPLTNDDIAKELRHARAWVENMLILHDLPDETKKAVDDGKINYTEAVNAFRKENPKRKKEPKQLDIVDKESGEVINTVDQGTVIMAGGKPPEEEDLAVIEGENDPLFDQCAEYTKDKGRISTGMLQRDFNLGYNRAYRILTQLNEAGIIGTEVLGYWTVIGNEKIIVDTTSVHDIEEDSHKTKSTFTEQRPKSDREDALEQRDFKTDKETCDMNLNEVQKYLDKLEYQIGLLQDHIPGMKQAKGDMASLINGRIRKLLRDTQELLKKAPDKGTIS